MKFVTFSVVAVLLLLSAGCGTDTSSSGSVTNNGGSPDPADDVTITVTDNSSQPGPNPTVEKSSINLRLTDAPLDDVAKVVVTFLSVEILRENPEQSILIEFNTPKVIDLLSLQGLNTQSLLSDIELDAGTYDEIRLIVDDSAMNSYIELDNGGVFDLKIPSGSSSGLKIKGDLVIPESKPAFYTVDFDVRKSIVRAGNSGKYLLKPVLRLVEDALVGHVRGTVDAALLTVTDCSDSDPDTFNAVYVYQGLDVEPSDIDLSSNAGIEPITTAVINFDNETGDYLYEVAFLPAGDYTIAFTCNSDQEDPEATDDLLFFGTQNITVQINDILFL